MFCGPELHWLPMQVINSGKMEQGISGVTHWKHAKRMHQEAGINCTATTHMPRKVEAREVRCTHHTSVAELKQTGLWDQDVATKAYTSLPSGNAVANNAGFVDRGTYYIPRADLHPSLFGETYAGRWLHCGVCVPSNLCSPHSCVVFHLVLLDSAPTFATIWWEY
jgi:hypothetical protein